MVRFWLISLFMSLSLCLVCVYFSTVRMSPRTWAFWATQLNVVSKTLWQLTVFKSHPQHSSTLWVDPVRTNRLYHYRLHVLPAKKEVSWNIKMTVRRIILLKFNNRNKLFYLTSVSWDSKIFLHHFFPCFLFDNISLDMNQKLIN